MSCIEILQKQLRVAESLTEVLETGIHNILCNTDSDSIAPEILQLEGQRLMLDIVPCEDNGYLRSPENSKIFSGAFHALNCPERKFGFILVDDSNDGTGALTVFTV